jgi:plasmid stabilization system protein ParE
VVVTFNELAERELNDAAAYYDVEQPGLGAAFLLEVERCTLGIVEFPLAAPEVLGAVRRRLCDRFPYAVLYTASYDEIRVLAIMNLHRRPAYWVGRS